MGLLPCGLLLKKARLVTRPTLQLALLPLPGLRPATIEQCQTQGKHGIDVLGSPMHAWPCRGALASPTCDRFPHFQTQSASPAEGWVG
jgi:hypothetical protein